MGSPEDHAEPIDWTSDAPRSSRFGDIYFSPIDGLAETRAVFLRGCGLPEAWLGRRRFTVGELGFGTGLNILALIDLWRSARPSPQATLHVFSVEGFPISRADAARALAAWPELADSAEVLLSQWPGGRRGFHRVEWPDDGVSLDLAVMDVEAALCAWSGPADAWFLDGFAPSKNPQMWSPRVMALLAARSNPGARAATFSVAGAVRRGLQGAGFEIERAAGFGRKKERLEARFGAPVAAPAHGSATPKVAVIGGGIAGASLARAFRRLGQTVTIFDGPGVAASGNASALVTPRLDAGLGPVAELYAQAFTRAVGLYRQETPGAVLTEGALQLAVQPRDGGRFEKISAWDGFDPGGVQTLNGSETAALLDEAQAPEALYLKDALVVEPAAILKAWSGDGAISAEIERIEALHHGWRLVGVGGALLMEADIVCLAAGPASTRLADGVPLRAVRGQVNAAPAQFSGAPAAFGGYAIPMRGGVLFGATHDRDDWGTEPRVQDDDRNRHALRQGRPVLADRLEGTTLKARASLRAMSPDHLPLAGAVPGQHGLFVLSGFGGRGFTLAPLLAEAVAAEALGAPSPLPRASIKLVDPARFRDPGKGRT
jgi:tRNA 5-methylaminomethyl-2-thiouridine biosynthesis bifunctional protein